MDSSKGFLRINLTAYINAIHQGSALKLAKQFQLQGFAKDDSNSVICGKMFGGRGV